MGYELVSGDCVSEGSFSYSRVTPSAAMCFPPLKLTFVESSVADVHADVSWCLSLCSFIRRLKFLCSPRHGLMIIRLHPS